MEKDCYVRFSIYRPAIYKIFLVAD